MDGIKDSRLLALLFWFRSGDMKSVVGVCTSIVPFELEEAEKVIAGVMKVLDGECLYKNCWLDEGDTKTLCCCIGEWVGCLYS